MALYNTIPGHTLLTSVRDVLLSEVTSVWLQRTSWIHFKHRASIFNSCHEPRPALVPLVLDVDVAVQIFRTLCTVLPSLQGHWRGLRSVHLRFPMVCLGATRQKSALNTLMMPLLVFELAVTSAPAELQRQVHLEFTTPNTHLWYSRFLISSDFLVKPGCHWQFVTFPCPSALLNFLFLSVNPSWPSLLHLTVKFCNCFHCFASHAFFSAHSVLPEIRMS